MIGLFCRAMNGQRTDVKQKHISEGISNTGRYFPQGLEKQDESMGKQENETATNGWVVRVEYTRTKENTRKSGLRFSPETKSHNVLLREAREIPLVESATRNQSQIGHRGRY